MFGYKFRLVCIAGLLAAGLGARFVPARRCGDL